MGLGDCNFEKLGIGGLGAEFGKVFRRAFGSRIFPPSIVAKLGVTHVKGILLHGPPGTGKTDSLSRSRSVDRQVVWIDAHGATDWKDVELQGAEDR